MAEATVDFEALPTERAAIADLKPHPANYREHPEDQLAHIGESLRKHGQYRNVVVARDLTILAGHGVVEAAQRIGWTELLVIRLDLDPDDPAAVQILTGDNEIGRLAIIDDRLLSEHLRGLAEMGELLGTGFDDQMLANLVYVTRPMSEIQTMNEAAQWVGMPEFEGATDAGIRLVVHFDEEKDRDDLIAKLELTVSKKLRQTWSAYWPPRPRQDLASLRFEGEPDAT